MTPKKLRDWHARRKGWTCTRAYYGKDMYHDETWTHPTDNVGFNELDPGDHPCPDTIDGAAAAMPPGWGWVLCWQTTKKAWIAQCIDLPLPSQTVEWTGNEIKDRYALAKLAWEAMGEPSR
jgi:hypothetical protein